MMFLYVYDNQVHYLCETLNDLLDLANRQQMDLENFKTTYKVFETKVLNWIEEFYFDGKDIVPKSETQIATEKSWRQHQQNVQQREQDRQQWVQNTKHLLVQDYKNNKVGYDALKELSSIEIFFSVAQEFPKDFPQNQQDANIQWWLDNAPCLLSWAQQKINQGTLQFIPPKLI